LGEFRKRRPDARKIPPIAFTYIAARYANSHDDCIEQSQLSMLERGTALSHYSNGLLDAFIKLAYFP
jgi:hypothetical protein